MTIKSNWSVVIGYLENRNRVNLENAKLPPHSQYAPGMKAPNQSYPLTIQLMSLVALNSLYLDEFPNRVEFDLFNGFYHLLITSSQSFKSLEP